MVLLIFFRDIQVCIKCSVSLLIGKTADALLTDLNGYDDLKRNVKEFCEELEEYHTDQFDSWSREMLHMIDTQELRYYDGSFVQYS